MPNNLPTYSLKARILLLNSVSCCVSDCSCSSSCRTFSFLPCSSALAPRNSASTSCSSALSPCSSALAPRNSSLFLVRRFSHSSIMESYCLARVDDWSLHLLLFSTSLSYFCCHWLTTLSSCCLYFCLMSDSSLECLCLRSSWYVAKRLTDAMRASNCANYEK